MQKKYRSILFGVASLLCLFAPYPIIAQWAQTNGPFGGFADAMVMSGTTLIAGTSAGVYVSSDNGATWNSRNIGLTNPRVEALAVSGSLLYASAGSISGPREVFRSLDLGLTWTKSNTGMTSTDIRALCIHGGYVLAGTEAGIFRANTSGGSWSKVTSGTLGTSMVHALTVSGSYVVAGSADGVYRSADAGRTWKKSSSGLPGSSPRIRALCAAGSDLYAGGDAGVFYSSNGGGKWTARNTGLVNITNTGIPPVYSLAANGSLVYAGTYDGGVLKSTNKGANWTPTSMTFTTKMMAVSGAAVFAGTTNSLQRSMNGGASWAPANSGILGSYVYAFASDGAMLLAGVTQTGSGTVTMTTDGGASWLPGAAQLSIIDAFLVNGSEILAGSWNGLWRSIDHGSTWTKISTLNYIKAFANDGTALFMGLNACCSTSYNGVYRSNDGGTTWIMSNNGLTETKVEALAVGENVLFAGTAGGGVFRSDDHAASWTAVNNGLTDMNIRALVFAGSVLYAGTAGGQVFTSTDGAASWSWAGAGLTSAAVNTLIADGSAMYAGTTNGVFATNNNGVSWNDVSAGMTGWKHVEALQIFGSEIFAGTVGHGVWKRPLSQLPKHIAEKRPSTIRLEQNHPNPFNPSTTIRYTLPENGAVTLRVYDHTGRLVGELENGIKDAGTHTVLFDASHLASGVYFYRLEALGQARMGTMMLLR
ncbi:MAG: T9SS type A sorting domain-containing protein [Ignavibacteriae bacterium]|nr:T9SS type A sorting domain-containing protein [Ignavibacteriota bacterium]